MLIKKRRRRRLPYAISLALFFLFMFLLIDLSFVQFIYVLLIENRSSEWINMVLTWEFIDISYFLYYWIYWSYSTFFSFYYHFGLGSWWSNMPSFGGSCLIPFWPINSTNIALFWRYSNPCDSILNRGNNSWHDHPIWTRHGVNGFALTIYGFGS